MRGWRVPQLRAALGASLRSRRPRVAGVALTVTLAAASFGYTSVQLFGSQAQAATPNLTTTASGATEVGFEIFDNANLTGGTNPTGMITFSLFAPGDTTCSTPIFTPSTPVVPGTTSYNSAHFTTTQAGTYQWTASYSGDANNTAASTACNDLAEQVVVTKANTVLTTTASAPIALGGTISDTAHLAGGFNPTGTITFELSGPGDTFCSAAPVFTSPAVTAVNGNGDYVSGAYTPTQAGLYKWRARYNGDANNLGDGPTACLDPAESVLVAGGLVTPTLTTTASASVPAGGQIHDTATLAGGVAPTGTIGFQLFGPDDTTCATPVGTIPSVTVAGNGQYQSADVTASTPGTYRFVATYSGDVAHNAVVTACNDPGESVVVTSTSASTTTTNPSTTTTAPTTSTTVGSTSTTAPNSSTTVASTSTTAPNSSTTVASTSTTAPTGGTSTTAGGGTSSTTAPTSSTSPPTTTGGGGSPSTTSPTSTSVPPSTTTTVPSVPTGTTSPPVAGPTISVTPRTVVAGQDVTVSGSGFPAGRPIDILLFSTPVLLGTTAADGSGSFRATVTIPVGTAPGTHSVVAAVRGGGPQAETALTVVAPSEQLRAATAAPAAAARGVLSRTGSDLSFPAQLASVLMVVGLLLVGGTGGGRVRRLVARKIKTLQRRPRW
ncbi:MAG: hypothetical protein QOI99_271 [Actinomycetota bacterium]|nr:hypothetical protein [Actinomycetota bacterium]